MAWKGGLLAKFNKPLENATIEILSIDREVIYQQYMDAKTNDTLSIELPKNKPGKYIIEIISPQGILEGEFYPHPRLDKIYPCLPTNSNYLPTALYHFDFSFEHAV